MRGEGLGRAVQRAGEFVAHLPRREPLEEGALDSAVTTVTVVEQETIPFSLAPADSQALEPGEYRLTAVYSEPGGTASARFELAISLERQAIDTAAHLPPLDSSQLRPEQRPGGPFVPSLLTGLAVGVAAAAIPVALWNPDLGGASAEPRALAVGGAITLGGIVGMITGRRMVPIQENIGYNQSLLTQRAADNQRIAAENETRRRLAPLRVRVVGRR